MSHNCSISASLRPLASIILLMSYVDIVLHIVYAFGILKPLNDEFKNVIQKYDSKPEDELVEIAKEILQSL